MIFLGIHQSRINVAAIIFYTCILIPLHQLKEDLLRFIYGLVPISCQQQEQPTLQPSYVDMTCLELEEMSHHQHCLEERPLAVVRFGELEAGGRVNGGGESSQVCSICLVEFQREDEVSQLSRCRHVFHPCCIKSWFQRSRFTCPLCRRSIQLRM